MKVKEYFSQEYEMQENEITQKDYLMGLLKIIEQFTLMDQVIIELISQKNYNMLVRLYQKPKRQEGC